MLEISCHVWIFGYRFLTGFLFSKVIIKGPEGSHVFQENKVPRTDAQKDGKRENSIHHHNQSVFAGGLVGMGELLNILKYQSFTMPCRS